MLVVASSRSELVVDFRYATAARVAVAADPDRARHITIRVAPASLDEMVADGLAAGGFTRIGVESSSISLARFNRLSSAVATETSRVLVPTERIIESPYIGPVALTPKENELLALLAENPSRTFSRQQILSAVFSPTDGLGTVDTYVHYLRKKTEPGVVLTVRGKGYRLGSL